jgi:hypothetical protein
MTNERTGTKCDRTQPLLDFPIQERLSDGTPKRRTICKPCYAAGMREYLARNPEQARKKRLALVSWQERNPRARKDYMLRLKYGVTVDHYEQLMREQNGKCAVCSGDERGIDHRTGKPRALAVDHCHATGTIRGLLCSDCNRCIGMAKEDVRILSRMISYLARHKPRLAAA